MQLKNYYGILEIEPSATQADIKKAYRKLALQYHPDKSGNNPAASARFADIKEAYEILMDPSKKEYYLQHRWYEQSIGKRKKWEAVTAENLLKQAIELERYVSRLDHFRMDKYGLRDYIANMISDENIETLKNNNDPSTNNDAIIKILLQCCQVLPLDLVRSLQIPLKKLANSVSGNNIIDQFIHRLKKNNQHDKYNIWIILFVTITICALIFLFGR